MVYAYLNLRAAKIVLKTILMAAECTVPQSELVTRQAHLSAFKAFSSQRTLDDRDQLGFATRLRRPVGTIFNAYTSHKTTDYPHMPPPSPALLYNSPTRHFATQRSRYTLIPTFAVGKPVLGGV